MYSRIAALGLLTTLAYALPIPKSSTFTLASTGAVAVRAAGPEAHYGVVPDAVRGGPILLLSLGDDSTAGAVHLSVSGERPPAPGRYPIRSSWEGPSGDTAFHAAFMAGTARRPRGWFHGESGSVTITEASRGRMSGVFELRARGFTDAEGAEEDEWVTVRGTFEARGDSTAMIAAR
jgi:hypothetical protein